MCISAYTWNEAAVHVLTIALFTQINLTELWIEFGSRQNQLHLPDYTTCDILGTEKSKGLLLLHAFTECDQTLLFINFKNKKWQKHRSKFIMSNWDFSKIEIYSHKRRYQRRNANHFVVLTHSWTSTLLGITSCHHHLFVKKAG